MISDGFDERTQANMEVALERACRSLTDRDNTHDNRKRVAQALIDCVQAGRTTLTDLTAAAKRAVQQIEVDAAPPSLPSGERATRPAEQDTRHGDDS
jgi:hypothetical protein